MSTNALPFTVDLPPQLISLKQPRRSFTIHNAKSRPVDAFFGGVKMIFPAVHIVDTRHADTDADGDLIPGSYVVEDEFEAIPEIGDEVLIWDAVKAVRHVLGIQPASDGTLSVATSPYALGGLSILPRHSTKEQWKAAAAAGEKRAFVVEVENARTFIASIDEKNAKRKAAGMDPVPPGGFEYARALQLITQYNELVRRQTTETLAPHQVDELDEDLEFDAFAKAATLEIASRVSASKNVSREDLAMELLNDPAVRLKLQKKFHIKKRGELPIDAAKLADAAASGQTVAEAGLEGEAK